MNNVLLFLSDSPISINALSKASGLGQTALAIALVELGGRVAVKDNGIVLAVAPVVEKKVAGPRGPNSATKPCLEIARNAILSLTAIGPVDAVALLAHVGETALYTDLLLVAREECAKGTIVETRRGRKAIWSAPVPAEVAQVEETPAE